MKKTALASCMLVLLLVVMFQFSSLAEANFFEYLPSITIKNDGTVEPITGYINQTGNTYALTGNIYKKYAVVIQCSNIVFDGAGHIIDGSYAKGVPYLNGGLSLEGVTNVTIKNMSVVPGIGLSNCSECTISNVMSGIGLNNGTSNVVTECNLEYLSLGENNQVTKSNITSLALGKNNIVTENNITQLRVWHSAGNTVYNNTIYRPFFYNEFYDDVDFEMLATLEKNHWEGNFWGDYSTRYPNASEIGDSGIGDIAYVIDANNIDNYPLMAPYVIPHSPLPTPLPPTPEPQHVQQPFPTTLVVASVVLVAVIGVGLLVYFRKRNH
jgi:hypothetical protein